MALSSIFSPNHKHKLIVKPGLPLDSQPVGYPIGVGVVGSDFGYVEDVSVAESHRA